MLPRPNSTPLISARCAWTSAPASWIGVAPYPVAVERTTSLAQVRERFPDLEPGASTAETVSVTGRVIFVRNTGKLCFATLQETGAGGRSVRLQAMLSLAEVGADALTDWKALVDLGDHVQVTGEVITSRRGELSVMADSFTIASKAIRPLPVLHAELNEETRVRQRYADLIVRDEAREMVYQRAAITRAVRDALHARDYVEIETPILQLVHGGAQARPFRTHLNAFDQPMTLRIATELYLKRAVVGGIDRVFEIGRVFRNEGEHPRTHRSSPPWSPTRPGRICTSWPSECRRSCSVPPMLWVRVGRSRRSRQR